MKTLLVALVAGLIGGIVGAFIGANQVGSMIAQDHLGDEFRIHHRAFQRAEGNEQMREYLKSRMYYIACLMEPGNLADQEFDFGAVDESKLRGVTGIKGPDTEREIYEGAMTLHGQSTEG